MTKKTFMDETWKSLFSPSLSYKFMSLYDLILYFVLYFYTLKQGIFLACMAIYELRVLRYILQKNRNKQRNRKNKRNTGNIKQNKKHW